MTASKRDFQRLANWCTQPSANPYFRRGVGAHVLKEPHDGESSGAAYEGFLTYTPARATRVLPEHFSGSLRFVGGQHSVTVALAVGDRDAVAGFTWSFNGRYDELDVEEVTLEEETVVHVRFGRTDDYTVYAYLYPSLRYVHQGAF